MEFAQTAVKGEKTVEVDDSRSKPVEERIENALVKVKVQYIFLSIYHKKSI